jgi:hypothetical protein
LWSERHAPHAGLYTHTALGALQRFDTAQTLRRNAMARAVLDGEACGSP